MQKSEERSVALRFSLFHFNVVLLRFERGLREPKTLVLPLHHNTILKRPLLGDYALWITYPFANAGAKLMLLFRFAKRNGEKY